MIVRRAALLRCMRLAAVFVRRQMATVTSDRGPWMCRKAVCGDDLGGTQGFDDRLGRIGMQASPEQLHGRAAKRIARHRRAGHAGATATSSSWPRSSRWRTPAASELPMPSSIGWPSSAVSVRLLRSPDGVVRRTRRTCPDRAAGRARGMVRFASRRRRGRPCRHARVTRMAGNERHAPVKHFRKRKFPLDQVRRFLEPGPIVLVSSASPQCPRSKSMHR